MSSALIHLRRLFEYLDARSWSIRRTTSRFIVYGPPSGEGGAARYELYVPRDPAAEDFERALDNAIAALADYYQTPLTTIEAVLLPHAEVMSVRLGGERYRSGAARFPEFERTVEHIKRAINRTASFVITDDPFSSKNPAVARQYFNDCWFLQTARGSFVARVALPTVGEFGALQGSLFASPVSRAAVPETMRKIAILIGNRVLAGDESVYGEEQLTAQRGILSIGVMHEFAGLLRDVGTEEVSLRFERQDKAEVIEMPRVTAQRLEMLDRFVNRVAEHLRVTFPLDVSGRVFQVSRSRRRSSSSMVGVTATVDNRQQDVTFRVGREVLPVFLEHFNSQLPIRVYGMARRLRTQLRIQEDFGFEESGR